MTSKRCFKCLCEKPLEAFYAHARMADGLLGKCKECTKKDASAHRMANLEVARAYDKSRANLPHRRALASRVMSAWKAAFPERREAHHKVAYALRTGALTKQPCWVCGLNAVAHHPDYSRPLDVVWLCQPHHKQAHALIPF